MNHAPHHPFPLCAQVLLVQRAAGLQASVRDTLVSVYSIKQDQHTHTHTYIAHTRTMLLFGLPQEPRALSERCCGGGGGGVPRRCGSPGVVCNRQLVEEVELSIKLAGRLAARP